jgi:hypothetical protein
MTRDILGRERGGVVEILNTIVNEKFCLTKDKASKCLNV